jgi:nucleotide-binding universal stress UspA family protein
MTASASDFPEMRAQPWYDEGKAVVTAVDGSERNHAAIAWAIAEAAISGRPVKLVHVLDERRVPSPFHAPGTDDEHAWALLDRLQAEILTMSPTVVVQEEVIIGHVADSLLSASSDEHELVVGRRGFGTFARLLIGSTSLKAAAGGRVPVVVVPDRWVAEDHKTEPVVVGVDRRDIQPAVLYHAFDQARLRHAPLVAAHGADLPFVRESGAEGAFAEGPPALREADVLENLLEPYRSKFPDVRLSILDRAGHPLSVLLDDAGPSQLLVLGRHSAPRGDGFEFGSVAHGVLHYAEVPVVVVPPVS